MTPVEAYRGHFHLALMEKEVIGGLSAEQAEKYLIMIRYLHFH